MLVGSVVIDGGLCFESNEAREEQVPLGRVEIPAGWIDPEAPAGAGYLLPGGEGQRVIEQLRNPAGVQGAGRSHVGPRQVVPEWERAGGDLFEHVERRAAVAPEGIRLG
jgi:hypothetical protein